MCGNDEAIYRMFKEARANGTLEQLQREFQEAASPYGKEKSEQGTPLASDTRV